jgi:hypothetical protein
MANGIMRVEVESMNHLKKWQALSGISGCVLLMAVAGICGCKDEGEAGPDKPDTGLGTPTDSDTGTGAAMPKWSIEMVQDESFGIQARMALGPNDMLGMVWYANSYFQDGTCEELDAGPAALLRQRFYLGTKAKGAVAWTVEEVDDPAIAFEATGLSLAFSPSGDPAIAYTGGEPDSRYWCGGNDAVLATRTQGQWQFDAASTLSGDSQSGLVGSDEGMVVGLWPALAFSASGDPAIVHKDAHFGSQQSIDDRKADAEFAWRRGGSWIHEYIDANEGAGEYNALVFDGDVPIAFYGIPVETQQDSRKGIWAARRAPDGTWDERVQLHRGAFHKEIAAGFNPVTGELVAAFYSATDNGIRVRRLADLDQFADASAWTTEIATSAIYDEGQFVSLAFTPQGKEVLAYHRCRLNTSTSDSCDQNDEAAMLAINENGVWKTEVINEAEYGSCGEYTSVVVDSTGVAHVVYRCTETDGDQFYFRLLVAEKEIEAQ